jgi:hypothetical protein
MVEVLKFGLASRYWLGSATQLLRAINAQASAQQRQSDAWPEGPEVLGKQLRVTGGVLRELSLAVSFWRRPGKERQRDIILEKIAEGEPSVSGRK